MQWMGISLGKIMNLTTKDLRFNKLIGKIYNQIYNILYLLQNSTCVVVWYVQSWQIFILDNYIGKPDSFTKTSAELLFATGMRKTCDGRGGKPLQSQHQSYQRWRKLRWGPRVCVSHADLHLPPHHLPHLPPLPLLGGEGGPGVRESRRLPTWPNADWESPRARGVLHHPLYWRLWEDWPQDSDLRRSTTGGSHSPHSSHISPG